VLRGASRGYAGVAAFDAGSGVAWAVVVTGATEGADRVGRSHRLGFAAVSAGPWRPWLAAVAEEGAASANSASALMAARLTGRDVVARARLADVGARVRCADLDGGGLSADAAWARRPFVAAGADRAGICDGAGAGDGAAVDAGAFGAGAAGGAEVRAVRAPAGGAKSLAAVALTVVDGVLLEAGAADRAVCRTAVDARLAFASGALLKAVTFDAPVAETPDGRVARQRVVGASAACAGEPGDGEACRGQFQQEPGKSCRAVRYRCGERVGAFGQV